MLREDGPLKVIPPHFYIAYIMASIAQNTSTMVVGEADFPVFERRISKVWIGSGKTIRPVRLKSDERRNIISHSALLV